MKNKKLIGLGCVMVCVLVMTAGADTHYVAHGTNMPSGSYTTWDTAASNIQDAVGAAAAGDVVLVSNGFYDAGSTANGRVDISVYNFTLLAVSTNPYDTVIDGGGTNRVMYVNSTNVIIGGFLITNGITTGHGAGVYNNKNDPNGPLVLTNCVITGNRANGAASFGGGVAGSSASPNRFSTIINNCLIEGNTASYVGGGASVCILTNNCRVLNNLTTNTTGSPANYGGIYGCTMYGGSIVSNWTYQSGGGGGGNSTSYNVVISYNTAASGGGGGLAIGAAYGCSFYNNSATNSILGFGGGIYGVVSLAAASNCWFVANSSYYGGAASYATLTDCVISNNIASRGGGISKAGSTAGTEVRADRCVLIGNSGLHGGAAYASYLTNCLVVNNNAGTAGMGTGSGARDSYMVNCTVVSNKGNVAGVAGVYGGSFTNCIVWGNYAGGVITNYNGSPTNFSYSCTYPQPTGSADGGGNISVDPQFVDRATGNYRLDRNSPCVNAGINMLWMTGAVDLDKRRRLDMFSGSVDIGCYECIPNGTMFKGY